MKHNHKLYAAKWWGRALGVLVGLWTFNYLVCNHACHTSIGYRAVDALVRAIPLLHP